jgi:hypothetical protein
LPPPAAAPPVAAPPAAAVEPPVALPPPAAALPVALPPAAVAPPLPTAPPVATLFVLVVPLLVELPPVSATPVPVVPPVFWEFPVAPPEALLPMPGVAFDAALQALPAYIAAKTVVICPNDFSDSELIEFLRAATPTIPLAQCKLRLLMVRLQRS